MGASRDTKRHVCVTLFSSIVCLTLLLGCGQAVPSPTPPVPPQPAGESDTDAERTPRLALWLAKKNELIAHEEARYDLVMAGWFEQTESETIRSRTPSTRILAGLTHTWILDDPSWLELLITVANGGDAAGPLQISDDMYLVLNDHRCSLPDWEGLYAMDPRHPGWRELILAYYETVAKQPQHDGIIVDMVDAFPFCEGAWSGGVPTPIDATAWVSAQDELLRLIRERVPPDKWILANAGHDFPADSPFPQHLNGYLLENFGGLWGASLEEGLASAPRALQTTRSPHVVVFAVDTDDTGEIDWRRFRVGYAASLLFDHTYFAFDRGPRDHGGVTDWWFSRIYEVSLGDPLGPHSSAEGTHRRDFEKGLVVVATERNAVLSLQEQHVDVVTGEEGMEFTVPKGDARVLLRTEDP